jgi:hypothetical protein
MTDRYHPANTTEGAQFERSWCRHCLNDKWPDWEDEFGNDVPGHCPILDIAQYASPPELVVRDGVPTCLAYEEDPTNPARCLTTLEMF